jgi:hypothetical protein
MPFPDATFDVILSNLCLHNVYDLRRAEARGSLITTFPPPVAFVRKPMKLLRLTCIQR